MYSTTQLASYRIRLIFGGDFNLAVWWCGLATTNNSVSQQKTALKAARSSDDSRLTNKCPSNGLGPTKLPPNISHMRYICSNSLAIPERASIQFQFLQAWAFCCQAVFIVLNSSSSACHYREGVVIFYREICGSEHVGILISQAPVDLSLNVSKENFLQAKYVHITSLKLCCTSLYS